MPDGQYQTRPNEHLTGLIAVSTAIESSDTLLAPPSRYRGAMEWFMNEIGKPGSGCDQISKDTRSVSAGDAASPELRNQWVNTNHFGK